MCCGQWGHKVLDTTEQLNWTELNKVKEETEKAGLKLNIQKTKTMTSSPIAWWQILWKTMETVTDFTVLGFKIIVDGDYSHEIKTLAP